ncbi:hypothetical protein HN51_011437, partial [Arachis hypogaea]
MEPPVGNKFRIGQKICGASFGEIYLGELSLCRGTNIQINEEVAIKLVRGAAAVANGKKRARKEPVNKATLQKQRHMIKSLLLGPGNANSFLSSSFQYPVVKIGAEDQSFIDSVMLLEMDLSFSCPVAKIPGTSALQISLCKEMVQWTRTEKHTFLRLRVE